MRILDGFDRLSTQEELHQVLAVLDEFSRSGWMVPQCDSPGGQSELWLDSQVPEAEENDAESLARFIASRPELKN